MERRLREVIGRRTRKGEKDSVVKALVEEAVVNCICVLGREKQKSGVWCVGGVALGKRTAVEMTHAKTSSPLTRQKKLPSTGNTRQRNLYVKFTLQAEPFHK
ncbi:hypothetical protein L1887_10008 [Cichorium endivia]|nr:hypothetical protein L1887_10008 [Cichorium endivia]